MYHSLRRQTLHYFARPQAGIRRTPLAGPATWRGDELRRDGGWWVELSDTQREELQAAVTAAEATGKALGQLARRDFPLPTLAASIEGWRREIAHGRGFVLIRGLPVDAWSTRQSELCYWCFGLHLGVPGAQNPQGDLLGHVRDQRGGGDVRYYRTNKALAVHCDAADVVGLLCLQPAKSGGLSRLVSSVTIYNELLRQAPALVEGLYRPLYFDTKGEGGIRAFPIAPCAYANGVLRTFWQSDYYRSAEQQPGVPKLTRKQHELLDAYDALANSPALHLDMALRGGDLQLVSNHAVLHARTAFEDWPEAERQRHLLRLWLSLPQRDGLVNRGRRIRSWMGVSWVAARELLRAKMG